MKQKSISILAAASTLLVLAGCQNVPASSEPAFTSTSIVASSGAVGSGEAEAVTSSGEVASAVESSSQSSEPSKPSMPFGGYSLESISFAENKEMPGSVTISYPTEMFSDQPVWMDSTHIYLEPDESTPFGAIADIETRTLTQTEAVRFPYIISEIAYGEDGVYLHLGDSYVWKMDKNFNPVSKDSYEEYNDFAVHMPTGTLYYFQQEDAAKPALYRKTAGGQPELLQELPALGDRDFYSALQVSPSGDKVLFYMIHYEMTAKYIYVYDTKADTLTEISPHYENGGEQGFWAPEGIWMGEQWAVLLNYEYDNDKCSSEIRYGIPPESGAGVFYNPQDGVQCSLMLMGLSYLDCAIFEGHLINGGEREKQKLFYFRDDGTYLSYTGEGNCYYPRLSPDYKYLIYSAASQVREGYGEVCVVPTESLWKPLDWAQVKAEMDGMIGVITEGK